MDYVHVDSAFMSFLAAVQPSHRRPPAARATRVGAAAEQTSLACRRPPSTAFSRFRRRIADTLIIITRRCYTSFFDAAAKQRPE